MGAPRFLRLSYTEGMRVAVPVAVVLAIACTEHEPDLTRVGDPERDASSDAMPSLGGGSGTEENATWCQALAVLEASCQRCHTDPPRNGAPVPIMTYEDTQAQYFNTDFKVWERMERAVASDFMPATFIDLEPPVELLTCEQKTTLLAWLEQGAELVGPENCTDADKTLLACAVAGAGGTGGSESQGGEGGK